MARGSSRYDVLRFRPTVWPGNIIAPPRLRPIADAEVRGDWIRWRVLDRRQVPRVQLPADFYLRELMNLSPVDLEGAAELVRTYGLLFDFDLVDLDSDTRESATDVLLDPPEDPGMAGGHHRKDVEVHLGTAQEAIATWIASQQDGSLDDLVEPEVTEQLLDQLRSDGLRELTTLQELRQLLISVRLDQLETTINAALSAFSIGIGDLETRQPTIYSVSFLQLYNHMVEHATLRRCANEPCGQYFVRQRGRAQYGQFRTTGVKYCSRVCARSQAQRQLRRRRRAA